MTPQRKAYIKQCSVREQMLRGLIALEKSKLKEAKGVLNKELQPPITLCSLEFWKQEIYGHKILLQTYRHELARLKRMDRVVVPREIYLDCYGEYCFECKCGHEVEVNFYEYCPLCGRKILLEKVK